MDSRSDAVVSLQEGTFGLTHRRRDLGLITRAGQPIRSQGWYG
jgi:hypothetical protein